MWNWLKSFFSNAINLVAKIFEAFMKWFIYLIEVAYLAFITSILLTYFPYAYLLYFMFYVINGEAVVEIWNPKDAQAKSIIGKIEKAPSAITKPNREQAEVLQAQR